ncbi:MAG: TatD family hydrolase [Rikenellaceae bacterium]
MVDLIDIHTHSAPRDGSITITSRGIHPWYAEEYTIYSIDWSNLADNVDSIGEIGLDFACDINRQKQLEVFTAQLEYAQQLQLPVVIHCVKAFEEVMATLKQFTLRAVILHGFIGSAQQAQRAVERGYFVSFGELTARSPKSINALKAIPLDNIFVESDVSTTPIDDIYRTIAQLKGCSFDTLRDATYKNYIRIFR